MAFLVLGRRFNDLLSTGHPNFSYGCAPKAATLTPLLKSASAHRFATASKIPSSLQQDQSMTPSWPTTCLSSQLRSRPRGRSPLFPHHKAPAQVPQRTPESAPVLRPLCQSGHAPRQSRRSPSHSSSSTHHPGRPCPGSAQHMHLRTRCFRCHTRTRCALKQTPPLPLS